MKSSGNSKNIGLHYPFGSNVGPHPQVCLAKDGHPSQYQPDWTQSIIVVNRDQPATTKPNCHCILNMKNYCKTLNKLQVPSTFLGGFNKIPLVVHKQEEVVLEKRIDISG